MTYLNEKKILVNRIKNVSKSNFNALALDLFLFQYKYNPLYNQFVNYLNISPQKVDHIEKIPFIPIDFYKNHIIKTGKWTEEKVFLSSGTTQSIQSKHFVKELSWYKYCAKNCFEEIYGKLDNFIFLALLPSYLEREASSLVYMANHFMNLSESSESDFFLYDYQKLSDIILGIKSEKKIILLGVSFALIDFAKQFKGKLNNVIIMETGGMKGRRKEMTKSQLHDLLKHELNVKNIHSEYGMTELLSQAYSTSNNIFKSSKFMHVLVRDISDPFNFLNKNKSGALNIIDLANIDTCSFIATDDIGVKTNEYNFKILGRIDNSEIRGCNLLYDI